MKSKLQRKLTLRPQRIFSEEVKKQVVRDIEAGKCTVKQASEELGARHQSIYAWVSRYSRYLQNNKRLVVENKSEAYRTKELEQRIQELEAALGRKQMEIDLLSKVIELADKEYKTDLKKSMSRKVSNGSGSPKGSNTGTK